MKKKHWQTENIVLKPDAVLKNTDLFAFLGLDEKLPGIESNVEERIITNIQNFLLEFSRGSCFEYRQRRIRFGNTIRITGLTLFLIIVSLNAMLLLL